MTWICRPLGYELLELDICKPAKDAILVKEKYLPLFGAEQPVHDRERFLREPAAIGRFYEAGFDSIAWRDEEDFSALLSEVWDACVLGSERRSGQVLPFLLTL